MAVSDNNLVFRRKLSQIGIRLPFFGDFVLFDNLSSTRQIRAIRRRLINSPNDPHLRLSLANQLVTEGKNEEALVEWLKAHMELPFDDDVKDNPEFSQRNAWSHHIFGLILYNKGALEEAIADMEEGGSTR